VEVIGRYSNHSDLDKRLTHVLAYPLSPAVDRTPSTEKQIQRRLRPPAIAELVAGYEAGATVYELSSMFQIHRHTVAALLKRQQVRLRKSPLSDEEAENAIRLYRSGVSLANVADEIGRGTNTIRRALIAHGVDRRDTHGRTRGTSES
jgi:transposase